LDRKLVWALEKRKMCPFWELNPDFYIIQPIA
jgi:hypothetical protein